MARPESSLAPGFSEPDQRVMAENPEIEEFIKLAFMEATQRGIDGVVADAALVFARKPYKLSEVSIRVTLWHGTDDVQILIVVG